MRILSMNDLAQSQARISRVEGCEAVSFQVRAGSARQILPQETWYRIGTPNLVVTGRISEQIR